MLKDEAYQGKKMSKINLIEVINNVVEDFKQDHIIKTKKLISNLEKINSKNGQYILGIGNG